MNCVTANNEASKQRKTEALKRLWRLRDANERSKTFLSDDNESHSSDSAVAPIGST